MLDILYNSMLPLGASLRLKQLHAAGDGLGRVMWTMLRGRRRETIRAIAEHLGLPEKRAAELGAASFRHTARAFLEIFFARRMDPRFVREGLEFENPDLMRRMGQSTRPVVAVGAHIGCWELMVGLFGLFPSKSSCQVVVRLPKDQALAAMILHLRSQPGVHILPHRDAATQTLPFLRKGGMAAFLVDHNCRRGEAEFLPFLGQVVGSASWCSNPWTRKFWTVPDRSASPLSAGSTRTRWSGSCVPIRSSGFGCTGAGRPSP
jgi:KDO2-lipid IV(A) lauroyltransferase